MYFKMEIESSRLERYKNKVCFDYVISAGDRDCVQRECYIIRSEQERFENFFSLCGLFCLPHWKVRLVVDALATEYVRADYFKAAKKLRQTLDAISQGKAEGVRIRIRR